jgi:hypothetical protein
MFNLLLPNTSLRALREKKTIYSRKGAKTAKVSMSGLCLSQIPLRTLRLGEIIFIFSRRGAEAAENFNV